MNLGESLMYLWKPNICSPSVGCARRKRQYPKVLQNLISFCWMLESEWVDYLLLIFGTWYLMCYVQQTTMQSKVDQPKETCAGQETIPSIKPRPKHQLKEASEVLSNCRMWTTSPQTHTLPKVSLSCTF